MEVALAVYSASRPRFYGRLGYIVDPKCLDLPASALIIKTVQEIAKDLGQGPGSEHVVLQRLRRHINEGKITQEQIDAAMDLLIESDMDSLPSEDEVISEVVPVIQRVKQADLVRGVVDEFSRKGDFGTVERQIRDIQRIGKQDTSIGLKLGAETLGALGKLRTAQRLPFGIDELDHGIGGGLIRGCQCLFIGGSGSGKSMALNHVAATALLEGRNVAAATLEISEELWSARLHAAVTRIPIDDILTGTGIHLVEKRINELLPMLGYFAVKHFPAKVTTAIDIERWVEEIEQREGIKIEVIVVDYVDKLASHKKEDQNEYAGQGTAAERLRVFAESRGMWSYTASQSLRKAGKEKTRKLDIDDGADSQHKVRIADLVITLNPSPDGEVVYRVVKWRHGKGNYESPPIPHAWEIGRICQ